jgi:hypothetical protein
VDLFSALLTPMIGITTAWIAVQQYRLAKERMRRDLYDRRVAVYRGVMEVLSSILTYGRVRDADMANWARATAEKVFLFDEDLCNYLESVRKKAATAWAIGVQLEPEKRRFQERSVRERRNEALRTHDELLLWLSNQLEEVQAHFAKYLRIA